MKKLLLLTIFVLAMSLSSFAQLAPPPESARQEVSQMVGDTKISIAYHRPNVKGRKIWGGLVPYGEVWRTGANNATVFEITNDVTVNGQKLAKGKYSLHTIPGETEWTIIFNKNAEQWGSFRYEMKDDVLRVTAKPATAEFHETMSLEIENVVKNVAEVHIRWDKIAVPFTVDVGDVSGRLLTDVRRRMVSEPVQMANYVLNQKMTANYAEALGWLDGSIKIRETFGNLQTKARILAETGNYKEAITVGEKAVQVGKAATSTPANTVDFEKVLTEWKTKK